MSTLRRSTDPIEPVLPEEEQLPLTTLRRGAPIGTFTGAQQSLRDNAYASPFKRSLLGALNTDVEGEHRTAMLEAQVSGDGVAERTALRHMAEAQARLELPSVGSHTLREAFSDHDYGNYLQNIAGSALGSMAKPLVGGIVGGAAGPVGAGIGALAGSYSAIRNAETARYGQDEELSQLSPEEQLRLTRKSALLQAAPEALLPASVGAGGRLFRSAATASTGKRIAGAMATEAGTEGLQSYTSQKVDQTALPDREVDWWDIAESAAAGGIVGGGFGLIQPRAPDPPGGADQPGGADLLKQGRDALKKQRDALKKQFPFMATPEEQAAADLRPDTQDPGVLGAADPAAAMQTRAEQMQARAAKHADILMTDPNTPDYVKAQVAEFGGDFTDPAAQRFVNSTLVAQRASEKMTAAVEGFAGLVKDKTSKAATAVSDAATKTADAVIKTADKAVDVAATAAAKAGTVLDDAAVSASDRIIRKNLQDVDLVTVQPLTQLLLTQLPNQDAGKAPDLARSLVAAAARMRPDAQITPAVEQRLRALSSAVGPEVIDLVSELSGNPALRDGLAKIRKIPNAVNDLENAGGNSLLEKMLKQPIEGAPLTRLAEMVDELGLKLKGMSAHQKTRALAPLAEVFGSEREAQVAVEYYGNLRRAAQEQEAARDAAKGETAGAVTDLFVDTKAEAAQLAEFGDLEETDGPPSEFGFRAKGPKRPFRKFVGERMSNGKMQTEAQQAIREARGREDADYRTVDYGDYLEQKGEDLDGAVLARQRDIEKLIKGHEAKQRGKNPENRSKDITALKGELQYLQDAVADKGAKAALNQYEVIARSEKATRDYVATDDDLKSMQVSNRADPASVLEFQRKGGTVLKLSKTSMVKALGIKRREMGRVESPMRDNDTQLLHDAVASVLAREDVDSLITELPDLPKTRGAPAGSKDEAADKEGRRAFGRRKRITDNAAANKLIDKNLALIRKAEKDSRAPQESRGPTAILLDMLGDAEIETLGLGEYEAKAYTRALEQRIENEFERSWPMPDKDVIEAELAEEANKEGAQDLEDETLADRLYIEAQIEALTQRVDALPPAKPDQGRKSLAERYQERIDKLEKELVEVDDRRAAYHTEESVRSGQKPQSNAQTEAFIAANPELLTVLRKDGQPHSAKYSLTDIRERLYDAYNKLQTTPLRARLERIRAQMEKASPQLARTLKYALEMVENILEKRALGALPGRGRWGEPARPKVVVEGPPAAPQARGPRDDAAPLTAFMARARSRQEALSELGLTPETLTQLLGNPRREVSFLRDYNAAGVQSQARGVISPSLVAAERKAIYGALTLTEHTKLSAQKKPTLSLPPKPKAPEPKATPTTKTDIQTVEQMQQDLVDAREELAATKAKQFSGRFNATAVDAFERRQQAAIKDIEAEIASLEKDQRNLLKQYNDELDSLYEGSPNAFEGQFGPNMKALYRKEELEKLIDTLESEPARVTKKSFVGERADPAMARFADQALKAGVPADEVWQQMGWFRGPDGKMRKEIRSPALKARIRDRLERGGKFTLRDLLKGLSEFDAYEGTPLMDVVVRPDDELAGAMGSAGTYNPMTRELGLNPVGALLSGIEAKLGAKAFLAVTREVADKATGPVVSFTALVNAFKKTGALDGVDIPQLVQEQLVSSFMHELQHAFQHADGFENGGSPTTAVVAKYGDVDEYLQAARDEDFETLEAIQREAFAAMNAELGPNADTDVHAHDLYESIIGEVEARDVQERMDLTDEEARGLKPALTNAKREFLRSIAVAEAMSKVRMPKSKSAENAGTGKVTKKQAAAIRAEVKRIRGDKVRVAFKKFAKIGGSGEFSMNKDKTDRLIQIALTAANPMGVAWHESLHDFFAMLDEDTAGRSIKRDLIQAADTVHVRKRLRELLKDHPKALAQLEQSAEERVAYMYQFWAEGPDVLTLGPTGEGIFTKLRDFFRELMSIIGLADPETRAEDLLNALHEGKFVEPSAVAEVLADMPRDTVRNRMERMAPVVTQTLDKLAMAAPDRLRDYQNDTLNSLADLLETFTRRRNQQSGVWQGKLAKVFKGTTAAERRAALENMQAMKPASSDLEKALAQYFKDIHEYMRKADVRTFDDATKTWKPLREVKDYFPRAFDRSAILKDRKAFEDLLEKHGKMDPKQAAATTDALVHGTGQLELVENEHALGFTPFAAAVKNRKLTFINPSNAAEFAKYQSKDMADILMGYTKQAVHRAEYARLFDNSGEAVNAWIDESGVKGKDRKDVAKVVQALEGSLGSGMSTSMKELQSGVLTLQNVVLLPLALFSQMIDPIVLAARTGDIRDAGKAYMTGIKRLVGSKDVPGEELAEILGIVAQDSVLEAMGNAYGTTHMSANMRAINQTFFKWNGMQGWNNSMRVAATAAGERYIMANKDDVALMEEIGLKPSDVKLNGQKLDISNPRIAEAMYQFVDQAVLRPSAANRPVWMSDPRFLLVAHLKQFTFAMHNVVLKRAKREMDAGNLKPWGILMLAMPTILAADMAKFALTGGPPPGWEFMDFMRHAVERSGLLGLQDFSTQAMHGVERGGVPGERLLGPAFEHAMELFRWVGNHPQVDTGDLIDRSVPLARYL